MPWYETPAFFYAIGIAGALFALVVTTLRFPDRPSRRAHLKHVLPLLGMVLVLLLVLGAIMPGLGKWMAVGVGLLLVVMALVGWARTRVIERRMDALGDPRRGPQALERLAAASRRTPRTAIYVARQLVDRGLLEEAERILGEPGEGSMNERERLMAAHLRVVIAIRAGRIDAAETALERMEPQSDDDRNLVEQSRALILALRGEGTQALRVLEDNPLPRGADPSWSRSRHLTEAHAYASLGDEQRARDALRAVLAHPGGRERLEKTRVDGPATPLVEAVLRGEQTPYR